MLSPAEKTVRRMPSAERRQQLIDVALRLFSKKGFRGTTTKEIASAAGVNQTILFRHFPTKDDLYAAILAHKSSRSRTEDRIEDLRGYAELRDDFGLFRSVISRKFEGWRRDKDFNRLLLYSALEGHEFVQGFRDSRVKPVFNFLCEYIQLRQREGAFRAVEAPVAVRALFSLPGYHTQLVYLFNCSLLRMDDDDAIESFTRFYLDGLRNFPVKQNLKKTVRKSGKLRNQD
jgi:TetR/AcrR family transcriptional regulator